MAKSGSEFDLAGSPGPRKAISRGFTRASTSRLSPTDDLTQVHAGLHHAADGTHLQ